MESRANVRHSDKQIPTPIGNEMTSGWDGVFALVSLGRAGPPYKLNILET
jgi:hypothetical protein